MSGIKDYSTTPSSNTTVNGIDVSEGCPPSSINNAIRQMMADTRGLYEAGGWVDWGLPHTFASSTSTAVAGDYTAVYVANRRIRAVGTSTGTIYGKVASSSYSAPNTTINYTWDSGSLSNEALTVSVGWQVPTGNPSGAGSGDLLAANNLSDLASAATARTNLGLGSAATLTAGTSANNVVQLDGSAKLPSVDGSALTHVPASIVVACSDETTALTVGTGKVTFRMPHAMTLAAVRASLTTAQSSGNIFTVDINEGGTSILSTKLTIDNTESTSTTAATAAVISDSSLADDAKITIDIDQVGDGTAKGLKVALIGTR